MNRLLKPAFFAAALGLALSSPAPASAQQNPTTPNDPLHAWVGGNDPAALESWVNLRLDEEKADIAKLLASAGPRTIENTLRPFDDAQNQLMLAGANSYLLYSLADSAGLRDKGQAMSSKVSSVSTELSLDQGVYKALAAIPTPTDPATRHYLERQLLEYRLSGVDKDEATRKKIRALQDKITDLTLVFGRNVADGTLTVKATKAELAGLPDDYIARHKPEADGTYTLTTDSPDMAPVLSFGQDAGLRRRMYVAYNSRAYPKNEQVLRDILIARQELATTLGFAHYADLATADQMIGNADNVKKLFAEVNAVSLPAAKKEYAQLLAFAQEKQPGVTCSEPGRWPLLGRTIPARALQFRCAERASLLPLRTGSSRHPQNRGAPVPRFVQAGERCGCVG